MELDFEKWLRDQSFSTESQSAFQESIICYKVSAYRAALIFSYIGYMSVIKERILKATNLPNGYSRERLEDVQTKLRRDNIWDSYLFDLINTEKASNLFGLSEDIRKQFQYWRDRRNDCAHSKDNEIIAAHIESYWSFIRSTNSKLAVNGGKAALINSIMTHYDPNFTSPSEPTKPLIQEISHVVPSNELTSFFLEIFNSFNLEFLDYWNFYHGQGKTKILFFPECLKHGTPATQSAVADFILSQEKLLVILLDVFPQYINILQRQPPLARSFWKNKLAKFHHPFAVIASLLNNEIINQVDIDEFFETVCTSELGEEYGGFDISDIDAQTLQTRGLWEYLDKKIIEFVPHNRYTWCNSNAKLICFHLETHPLHDEVLKAIVSGFSSNTDYHPRVLKTQLNILFESNIAKKQEFIDSAQRLSLILPTHTLTSLK